MPSYKAPVDDVMFLLSDVFHIDRYNNLPGFAEATPDLIEAVLGEAAKFCEDVLTPLNRVGDKEGCRRHDDGSVTTPTGFKDAYKQFTDGGWLGLSAPAEFGGQGLPMVMAQAVSEFLCSANMAFAMYSSLTQGAIAALFTHASAEQKALYLPKLVSGEWAGTMNLTEPQCGTDLGLVRTRAVPQRRRQLQNHRHEDFHLRRRARSVGEYRPSGAGAHRRRAGRHQGHIALHRSEISAGGKWRHRRAQRGDLRLDRREDGHPRQRHLRDELRRRDRLADGRSQPRLAGDVRDDERGAAQCRRAGFGAVGGRLSERRRLRQGTSRRPRHDRREISAEAGRSRSSCIRTCAAC